MAILGSLFVPTFYAMIASVSAWLRRKAGMATDEAGTPALEQDAR